MIQMLMGLGMSQKVAKIVAYAAIPLLILAAFYIALHMAMNAAYKNGKAASDKEWAAASAKTAANAEASGRKADIIEASRIEDHFEKVQAEKEKLDATVQDGTSPYDVLFPPAK